MGGRLNRLLQIRRDELGMVVLACAMFAATQSTHALGVNMADTLFFRRFGVEHLPTLFVVLGVVSVGVILLHGAGLARFDRRRYMPGLLAGAAALMLVQRAAVLIDDPRVYGWIWLLTNLVTLVTFTLMWNLAAAVCDTRQAKRLFAIFAAAGILGGVAGNFATGPLAGALGTENLLFLIAALLAVSSLLTRQIARLHFTATGTRPASSKFRDELRSGFEYVIGSRYFRLLGLTAAVSTVLFYAVVFAFSEAAAAAYPAEAELAGFLGIFSGTATVTAFLVSLLVAGRIYKRIGVVGAVFILPVVYVLGVTLWIFSFDLTTATLVRGVQWVTYMGLSATAFTALINVALPERRPQVMAFVVGVGGQLGMAAAGVFLIAGSALGSRRLVAGATLAVALGFAGAVWAIRPAYASQLVAALRAGLVDPFAIAHQSVANLDGQAEAIAAVGELLDDPHPSSRLLAIEMLDRMTSAAALPLLRRATDDEEGSVRAAALAAVDRIGGEAAVELAVGHTGDADGQVRSAAVAVLAHHRPQAIDEALARDPHPAVRGRAAVGLHAGGAVRHGAELIQALVADDDPDAQLAGLQAAGECPVVPAAMLALRLTSERRSIRLAAVAALARSDDPEARSALIEACRHSDAGTSRAAAEALRRSGVTLAEVAALLAEGPESARRAAVGAVTRADDRRELIRWASQRVPEAVELHRRATALGDGGPAVRCLVNMLEARELDIEQTILAALAAAEHRPALALIEQGLASPDLDTRAQALEALDTIADPAFSRPMLALLESEGGASDGDQRRSVLVDLVTADDALTRGVALLAGVESGLSDWDEYVTRGLDDPDPMVQEAARCVLGRGDRVGGAMADVLDTLGTVERVLLLQDVPIFAALPADDLIAIADIAIERIYADGDLVLRKGDRADEMLLLTDGQLVVRAGDRDISVRGAGEPVGELALLTHSTRSADVMAATESRVLVVRSDAFEAILADRPAVARALLSVLAERLAATT